MKRLALFTAILTLSSPLLAWDGVDSDTGESVTIEKGNLVRKGKTIEYYSDEHGEYKSATVESIRDAGSTVEVEVTDDDTGDTHVLEMEKR